VPRENVRNAAPVNAFFVRRSEAKVADGVEHEDGKAVLEQAEAPVGNPVKTNAAAIS